MLSWSVISTWNFAQAFSLILHLKQVLGSSGIILGTASHSKKILQKKDYLNISAVACHNEKYKI